MLAATGQLLVGAAVLAPIALGTSVASGFSLSPTRVLAITLLGAVGTGFAFLIHYGNIATMGATKASLVTYLIPVVAVVVGVVVLDEPFTWRLPIGGALTVAGIAAVTSMRAARAAPVPAAAVVAPVPAVD
jgi:drug/metabolite transporter (DMT)-like permease